MILPAKHFDHISPNPATAKAMGAFYTDTAVARFLVRWALRTSTDSVMDPSFGGGVFLNAACERLRALGGNPAVQVRGVELDERVHQDVSLHLSELWGIQRDNLRLSDFFDVEPDARVNAIVGNPPFIRYQRFTGDMRKRALHRARSQGIQLSELASSWAPFLIHSTAMLQMGGRMAMVTPVEIGHAAYALPVLQFLSKRFASVTFVTFRTRLFPDISEDTLLLLAENQGASFTGFRWMELPDANALDQLVYEDSHPFAGSEPLDAERLVRGEERLTEYVVPKKARELYHELANSVSVRRLGELADVGIGYVTGANDFFHLGPEEVEKWNIPAQYLRPAVRRGRALPGITFTAEDWTQSVKGGDAGYLLMLDSQAATHPKVQAYLAQGESLNVHQAYKCRTRKPWYKVPHVYHPHAFLTYMSGAQPRMIANVFGAVAPNTLHVVRLHEHSPITNIALATYWYTSLSMLSAEIEGHALGGGMLKLEPTEAERVLIATPQLETGDLDAVHHQIDALNRAGKYSDAERVADDVLLQRGLGLSGSDCELLRSARVVLRNRRCSS